MDNQCKDAQEGYARCSNSPRTTGYSKWLRPLAHKASSAASGLPQKFYRKRRAARTV